MAQANHSSGEANNKQFPPLSLKNTDSSRYGGGISSIISYLKPSILHLGASADLLTPSHVTQLKEKHGSLTVMRSIPVVNEDSIDIATSYDPIADILLLDSHTPGDAQIGALGVTHSWAIEELSSA
jgi:phosphoribosylanthranilate isomerase